MDELLPDTTISHYRIISKIGSGGMGHVYLAEDTRLDRKVALKFLSAAQAADDENLKRFTQEAKAASALNHQNILTIHEIGAFEGSPYIATEFIKGKTLRDLMIKKDLELTEALRITTQVAAALCAAHEAGIIHRDIKPENVMVRDDGQVKVLDFGLAKLSSAVSAANLNTTLPQVNTEPGMLMGTVAYMSPEQARGQQLDPRSDIFSLGIMMFELFTGKRPFEGEGHLDLISSILKDEVPTLRQIAPAMPRQLERIVDKALRKDKNLRYQHVRDLQIDVDDLRDELKLDSKVSRNTDRNTELTLIAPAATRTGDHSPSLTGSISTTRRFTILHAMIFAVAIAGVVGAAWYFRLGMGAASPLPGSYKTAEVASWTSAAGELFSNASFSPDGRMIAFSSTKSGTKNIWVTQTGSTEAIQVTTDGFSNIDPVWSPKGDEIAYFSDRGANPAGGRSQSGIWRIGALGGGVPRMVGTLNDGSAQLVRWTSTGKIYFQVRGDLMAMDAANGQTQKVLSLGETDISRIWLAPDEGSIAYPVQDGDNWRIQTRQISGGTINEVASGTGKVDGIAWLPEKNRLFYAATVDGVLQIFLTEVGSGRSARITASETDVNVVDVAPDGRSILTSSAKEESNIWRVNVADKQEAPIARDLNAKLWPSVSPDNTKIVFQSIKNLSRGNYLFDSTIVVKTIKQSDEGRPILLTDHGFLPQWSPDGASVAYGKETGGTSDLYVMNASGGGERRLTISGLHVGYSLSPYNIISTYAFTWSPDGRFIAYPSEQNGISNIWTVDVRDGSTTVLTSNNDPATSFMCPIWSGDGKRVAVEFQTKAKDANERPIRGLILADPGTRTSTTVFTSDRLHRLIGWSADINSLIIAEPSKFSSLPPDTTLKKIDVSVGSESLVANLKNVYFYNIFLADDRRSVAFSARNDGHDDIWVLPMTGGSARKITANNDSGLYYSRLAWLHDGSGIAFGKQTRFSLLSIVTGIE